MVYVPNGKLPTISQYKDSLEACGLTNVEIIDQTKSWAEFVKQRHQKAIERQDEFDKFMCGPGRREFFSAVARLFNPANGVPNGILGVRIYAQKISC